MNHQEKQANPIKLSLKDYVNTLDNSQKTERGRFRERLADLITCSPVTMIQKIRDNRWTQRERERIAEYLDTPIEILFPEEQP